MQHLVGISLVCLLLVACDGAGPSAPPAPLGRTRPPLLESFDEARSGAAGEGGSQSGADPWSEPETLDDLFFASGEPLLVEAGRLDGQIGEVALADDADEHLGYLDVFGGRSSLMVTVSARTERGVAMLIVSIDEGFDGPLFREGYLAGGTEPFDVEQLDTLSVEELEDLFFATTVMGCSGDSLADISFDEMATELELFSYQAPDDPNRWAIDAYVVLVDPESGEEQHASGSFEVVGPD